MKIAMPLDGTARGQLRALSKAVFNGTYVLEAILLIAQQDKMYAGELVKLTGCEGSYASAFLRKLHGVGLIEPVPREEGQQRIYYRRLPSPLWGFAVDWVGAILAAQHEAEVTQLHSRPEASAPSA